MTPDNQFPDSKESFYVNLQSLYCAACEENIRLKQLLIENNIPFENTLAEKGPALDAPAKTTKPPSCQLESNIAVQTLTKQSPLADRISLFISLFQGRSDVYARQWTGKDGKIGCSPACRNEWQHGLCGKPKTRCADCSNSNYLPYDQKSLADHLSGNQVMGIYPLLQDDTCKLLAIDFDEASWKRDVKAFRSTCEGLNVPCAVEISRSGKGAHVWLFFDEPIKASLARGFGSLLLTQSMRDNARLSFSSYDRMFPNQDTLPKGGFGNLIALPFQRDAYRNGGSIFVDEDLKPYPDQWTFLLSIKRISRFELETQMSKHAISALGVLHREDNEAKPWRPIAEESVQELGLPATLHCIQADRLYIPTDHLSQKAQNRIRRLAAFSNPQFFKAQAMRMPVWNKPRVICCAEYIDSWLCLPRGCKEELGKLLNAGQSTLEWTDEREAGRYIQVRFYASLRDEQQPAFDALLQHDEGVLSATTAFGKTVIAAALIGKRNVNTLIP